MARCAPWRRTPSCALARAACVRRRSLPHGRHARHSHDNNARSLPRHQRDQRPVRPLRTGGSRQRRSGSLLRRSMPRQRESWRCPSSQARPERCLSRRSLTRRVQRCRRLKSLRGLCVRPAAAEPGESRRRLRPRSSLQIRRRRRAGRIPRFRHTDRRVALWCRRGVRHRARRHG